mgnify:CR=1 FL=1
MSLGFSTVLAEAAACADRAGIEPSVLVDVLAKGGGAGVILQRAQEEVAAMEVVGNAGGEWLLVRASLQYIAARVIASISARLASGRP